MWTMSSKRKKNLDDVEVNNNSKCLNESFTSPDSTLDSDDLDEFDLDGDFNCEAGEEDDIVCDLRTGGLTRRSTTSSSSSMSTTSRADEDRLSNDTYESVSSPGGSSTASGPTYIRTAGFEHHAHEFRAPSISPSATSTPSSGKLTSAKASSLISRHSLNSPSSSLSPAKGAKKKKGLLNADFKDAEKGGVGGKKIEGVAVVSNRNKNRKEPLPMKQRALPQSFWQQPNVANPQSPGSAFGTLPPLPLEECDITPVEEVLTISRASGGSTSDLSSMDSSSRRLSTTSSGERIISQANTDLLFSLFNSVEEEENQRRIHVVRRGRPKKTTSQLNLHRMPRDEDPCLNLTSVESILPLIPDRGPVISGQGQSSSSSSSSSNSSGAKGTQVIKIMSISNGERSVELPSLNVEHNYPHLLSELVMKL